MIFVFVIFYKSLNKSNLYKPTSNIKNIPQFLATSFHSKEETNSKKIFNENKYYLLNIWASWCVPCRDEHSILVELSKNKKLEIVGLNYKDKVTNAKKFLNELENPYKKILLDRDGTIAIEWGAFGVPETFLIYKNIRNCYGNLFVWLVTQRIYSIMNGLVTRRKQDQTVRM